MHTKTRFKNPQILKKAIAVCLLIATLLSVFVLSGTAAGGNIQYPSGVTEEMCHAEYWAKKCKDPDALMMTADEIRAYNALAVKAKGTYVSDLEAAAAEYDASARKTSLASDISAKKPARELYINGSLIDNDSYFGALRTAFESTAWTGTRSLTYGVCTRQANLMSIPTDDVIGYSKTDADSEFQSSALNVNDPVLIRQICSYDGKTFYYSVSDHCSGWINAESLAICASREEWLDAWKTDVESDEILVVTQNRIVTEPSIFVPETANVKLTLGTVLKLVPEDQIPANLGERYAWNNYVVYLPVRNADGTYVKKEALISQHYSVSIGFLPMTQANILQVAFTCLGDRYGWGGMLDAMDCSMFNRNVYRCFGLYMPRNTTWQQLVPNTVFDISKLSDEEKLAFLKNTPAGAMLYFPGHTMIFTGMEGDTGYVISALGSAADSTGDLSVLSIYSVALNPLTVRRRNGQTWLTNLTAVVIPANATGKKYDPAAPAEPEVPENVCALCGKVHTGTWGKFVGRVHAVVWFLMHLFDNIRSIGC